MPGGISKLPRTHFGGVQVQTEDCAADLKVHDRLLTLSFEAGEQASHKVYLSQAARVSALRSELLRVWALGTTRIIALMVYIQTVCM